jgi:hypothetical protein
MLIKIMEGDNPSVVDAATRALGDSLIRNLFSDFGFEFPHFSTHVDSPLGMPIIHLIHGLDAFHKLWELFKLGPLVVGSRRRHIHIN